MAHFILASQAADHGDSERGPAGQTNEPVALQGIHRDLMDLKALLEDQNKKISRLYDAVEPELGEMEERAAAVQKEREWDLRLKLAGACEILDSDCAGQAQFVPREDSVALLTRRGMIAFFSADGNKLRELAIPEERMGAFVFAPDGKRLLAGTRKGKVFLWDLLTGTARQVFTNSDGAIGRVAWLSNPDRGVAASDLLDAKDKTAKQSSVVFRLADGELLAKFSSFIRSDFQGLAASADGSMLGVLEVPEHSRAGFLLDSEQCQIKATLYDEEYGCGPLSIGIAPDNNTVAVGYAPYNLSLWDGAKQQELRLVKAHSNWVVSLAFSPDSKRLISGAGDSTARIWDVTTGKELGRIRFDGQSTYVDSVSFSHDGGRVLAAAANGQVIICRAPK
jgi:WD40 repeat protein